VAQFVLSGRIFDVVLACVLIEIAVLAACRLARARVGLAADLLGHLCAATGLLLAARVSLAGAWWGYTGICLTGALAAHVAALRSGWERAHGRGLTPLRRTFSPRS